MKRVIADFLKGEGGAFIYSWDNCEYSFDSSFDEACDGYVSVS